MHISSWHDCCFLFIRRLGEYLIMKRNINIALITFLIVLVLNTYALAKSVLQDFTSQTVAEAAETNAEEGVKQYSKHGVSFNYDNRLKIKETDEKGTTTITLEGYEDLLLMIQVMDIPFLSGEDYAESLVKGMRDGMASSSAETTKVQKTSREIAKKKRNGYTFDYTLAGLTFLY